MLQLRALGTPSLDVGGGPAGGTGAQRKALALLGLLAVAGERGLSRDRILAYLWPESLADRAGHRLTQLLYSLRRDLRVDALFLGSTELRLNPALLTSDVDTFTDAVARGDYATAVAAYGGPFLDGFFLDDAPEFERWVDAERTRLARRYTEALEALALTAERGGDRRAAAEWWRRRVDSDPLSGRAVVCCMDALVAVGDRAEALQLARAHEARMREDLEAPPDPAVVAAVARLRAERTDGVGSPAPGPLTSVVVLPFVNSSPDQEGEYFSDGMTEELINVLARVPGLQVASRTTAFAFKGRQQDVRVIGERLNAGSLVEGSVRKVGRRIRMTVQLVNTADGYQRWSETYERTLEDVFLLQEELARAIVAALPLPTGAAPDVAARPLARDLEAYTLYLRGRYCVLKRTAEGLSLAIEYFEQAIERDPTYALAHAGLAECWLLRGFPEYGDLAPLDAMPKARSAALEAHRCDPSLPEAHVWLGAVHFLFDWDWSAAERELRRALELRADAAYAELWYAVLLAAMGRYDESLRRAHRAESLEPMSLVIQLTTARCYSFAGRGAEALERLQALRAAEPNHVLITVWLARALSQVGRPEEAAELMARVPERSRTSYVDSQEAIARALAGQRHDALALCERVERRSDAGRYGLFCAAARMLLGQRDEAVALVEQSLRERNGFAAFLGTSQPFTVLRSEPRIAALAERAGILLRAR